jgi:hypothetical protein
MITLQAGPNTVDFGILREGDSSNDNYVTLLDFSILASTFGKGQGDIGYDDRADFNEDNYITLLDFSLLAMNFGQSGASVAVNEDQTWISSSGDAGNVLIVVEPMLRTVNMGETFTVTVQVQSGVQPIDGAQASLNFDPTRLRVKSITGNTTIFPQILLNTYNNATGTIDYAAGNLDAFPSGNLNLAVIEFEAIWETQSSEITFNYGLPRNTDVTYAGTSILTGDQDGLVQINFIGFKVYLPLLMRNP